MPLTAKGQKIKASMTKQYGAKKGASVFYASINKGKVTGAEKSRRIVPQHQAAASTLMGKRNG